MLHKKTSTITLKFCIRAFVAQTRTLQTVCSHGSHLEGCPPPEINHRRIIQRRSPTSVSRCRLHCDIHNLSLYISEITEVTNQSLTPEIRLHLITPNCSLWRGHPEDCKVPDPFWAFYWPGGQALTRYVLDNPGLVRRRRVLDVGSGCGATAVASAVGGATQVTANDICPVAAVAMQMNADQNHVKFEVSTQNVIGKTRVNWDTILLGDMFYDTDFATEVADWLEQLHVQGKHILIGDPGRMAFSEHPIKRRLSEVAVYELPEHCKEENSGLTHGSVWTYS